MKVLMLGWEYPPRISGGLGTACRGLVGGLSLLGVEVAFVLPRTHGDEDGGGARILGCGAPPPRVVASALLPYLGAGDYRQRLPSLPGGASYGADLFGEVERYAEAVGALAEGEEYDLVHGHDWMTFPAAEAAAAARGVPLVLHVHSCERDRGGPRAHPRIEDVERRGAAAADALICVSRYTAARVVREYGADPARIRVVHNAAVLGDEVPPPRPPRRFAGPVILFLGRVTFQKGPEPFLQAAALVAREAPDARFVVAGGGDLLPPMIERAAAMGLGSRVHFAGFLGPADVERAYGEADVYVMPSVSEPFGITALEAMLRGVPTVVSRQSGAAEVLRNVLTADFWDAAGLADRILSILRSKALRDRLSRQGRAEARRFRWEDQAARVRDVYAELLP